MDQNEEHVLEVLRIILLACKSDMAINDVAKHFREWEGADFPFREFGCVSFENFLRRCDWFILKPTNNNLMVSLKQTANAMHDFVKEQTFSPLNIIYENDHAMRYGIQAISKQIQPRGHRRAIAPARIQCGPLLQIIHSKNVSNNRIDNVSVGPANKVVTVQVPVQPVQEQHSQFTVPVQSQEQSLDTTTKPNNFTLSKFSQALMRAIANEPTDLKQQFKLEQVQQSKSFDFAEMAAYRSAVQAIGVYCSKKGWSKPEYQFIEMNTKKTICSVTVNQIRYGCYPRAYETQIEAQKMTAKIALLKIKKLEECIKYPVCKDSPHDIAHQINACIDENGVFLDLLQTVFQSTYQQSLPDTWPLIIKNNTDLFKLETNHILNKTIVYPNKLDARATGTIKTNKSFCRDD